MKEILIEQLYNLVKIPYSYFFKKETLWHFKKEDLLSFPSDSLGHSLGCFLKNNDFELQESLENHDVFHVLTGIGTTVIHEIEMQFYLFGNGKKSLFLLLVLFVGVLFYPSKFPSFIRKYKKGKLAHKFYDISFLNLLNQPISNIRFTFNIQL